MGSNRSDGSTNGGGFVAAEVVQDDNVAGRECRDQHFFDISSEDFGVDRPLEDPGRVNPVMAQGGEERHGVPMAEGGAALEAHAARAPTAQRRHIGLGPGFINEDKTLWVHHPLIMLPPQPLACDIRAVLFLSQRAFF